MAQQCQSSGSASPQCSWLSPQGSKMASTAPSTTSSPLEQAWDSILQLEGQFIWLILFPRGSHDVASGMGASGHKSALVAGSLVTSFLTHSVPRSLRAPGQNNLAHQHPSVNQSSSSVHNIICWIAVCNFILLYMRKQTVERWYDLLMVTQLELCGFTATLTPKPSFFCHTSY